MIKNNLTIDQAINMANQFILNIDPKTGEVLEDSSKTDDLLIRVLKTLISPEIEDLKKMLNNKCGYPLRRGFSWTRDEDHQLIESFHKKVTIRDMSLDHQRSMTAISARLKHLKLIDDVIEFPRINHRNSFSIGY